MRHCTACGTRLNKDASRCWLCHAAAPAGMERDQADLSPNVIPMDHVWSGPLARTRHHADPDPIAAALFGRGARNLTFGQRLSGYVSHVLGLR